MLVVTYYSSAFAIALLEQHALFIYIFLATSILVWRVRLCGRCLYLNWRLLLIQVVQKIGVFTIIKIFLKVRYTIFKLEWFLYTKTRMCLTLWQWHLKCNYHWFDSQNIVNFYHSQSMSLPLGLFQQQKD